MHLVHKWNKMHYRMHFVIFILMILLLYAWEKSLYILSLNWCGKNRIALNLKKGKHNVMLGCGDVR